MGRKDIEDITTIADWEENDLRDLNRLFDQIGHVENLPQELSQRIQYHSKKLDKVGDCIQRQLGDRRRNSNDTKSLLEMWYERIENGDILDLDNDTADTVGRLEKSEKLMHRLMWSFATASQSMYEHLFIRTNGTKRKHKAVKSS